MAGPTTLWRAVLTAASMGMLLCLLGDVCPAAAQEDSSRRVRQYRRPWRSGVVSFGLQGQYGYNAGGTELTKYFDWGGGLAISARYAANKWASVGVRFEVHNFAADRDTIVSPRIFFGSEDPQAIDTQRITTAGLDVYLYHSRTKETMFYLNFGAGIYQLAILQPEKGFLSTPTARIERDNAYLMGGIGLEHFLRRTVSFDLNGKLFAYLGDDEGLPVSAQIAAGLQFYFFD